MVFVVMVVVVVVVEYNGIVVAVVENSRIVVAIVMVVVEYLEGVIFLHHSYPLRILFFSVLFCREEGHNSKLWRYWRFWPDKFSFTNSFVQVYSFQMSVYYFFVFTVSKQLPVSLLRKRVVQKYLLSRVERSELLLF